MNKWEPENDWFYESNIQNRVKKHFAEKGWKVIKEANTKKRDQGPDLLLTKNDRTMRVEIKGYPSDKYVAGKNKGKKKKTRPPTQARHWFGEALLTLILNKSQSPELEIVMALPDIKTYKSKVKEIEWLCGKIDLIVIMVSEKVIQEFNYAKPIN